MKARILLGFTALLVAAATATSIQVPRATAATSGPVTGAATARPRPTPPPSPDITARFASSWQTSNTVWALAYAHGVVYAGGQFTSVRPPGDKAGTGQVTRSYLAAFNASTGKLVTSFHPVITGTSAAEVTALAVSPDGKMLYVGGIFSHVNGAYRDDLAAVSLATGALTSWRPPAYGKVLTIALSPNGSEIYLGGDFGELDGVARSYAGAVTTSGALAPWAPVLDNAVTSIAVAPNDSRVVVGGYFNHINGARQNAIGSTNPVTGASEPFAATIVPNFSNGTCSSSVKDVVIGGATRSDPAGIAYIAAEGTGGGCFDGDFAAYVTSPKGAKPPIRDGALIWQNDCLGATQSLVLINGWLFKGSHAHDCAYAPGGFPQVDNQSATGVITHHLLDQSLTDGSIGHWTPDTNVGPTNGLGPRAMATDGKRLFLGGDFTSVNSKGQQGFAIFGPGPDHATPSRPAAPTVTSTSAGVDSVTFTAVSTSDIGTLSYAIYRDGGKKPIATVTATSWPWALPVRHYRDAGLKPKSHHTYSVTVSDGTRTSARSASSALVTVAAANPPHSYVKTILRDHPAFFWRLDQASGNSAADTSPHGFKGIYERGTTKGAAGPITGVPGTATRFNGRKGLVTAARAVTSPLAFSIEGWFTTTTNTGGELIGFGSAQTGLSSAYDRNIYMMNDGQLVFGIRNGQIETIETPRVYNDGRWHYVVATYNSAAGSNNMALYVDGQLIGTSTSNSAQTYSGYWRVGGDNLRGWNLDPWGSNSQGTTEPLSYYFSGTIADVAVYPRALPGTRVAAHYAANALSH
jgi:hypothetical protein